MQQGKVRGAWRHLGGNGLAQERQKDHAARCPVRLAHDNRHLHRSGDRARRGPGSTARASAAPKARAPPLRHAPTRFVLTKRMRFGLQHMLRGRCPEVSGRVPDRHDLSGDCHPGDNTAFNTGCVRPQARRTQSAGRLRRIGLEHYFCAFDRSPRPDSRSAGAPRQASVGEPTRRGRPPVTSVAPRALRQDRSITCPSLRTQRRPTNGLRSHPVDGIFERQQSASQPTRQ